MNRILVVVVVYGLRSIRVCVCVCTELMFEHAHINKYAMACMSAQQQQQQQENAKESRFKKENIEIYCLKKKSLIYILIR